MALDHAALEQLLVQITPTHPLCVDDCGAISEIIRPLTTDHKIDVMFTKAEGAIHIKVYSPQGLLVYERDLTAA